MASNSRARVLGCFGLLLLGWTVYESKCFSSSTAATGVEPFTRSSSTPFGDELMKLRDPFRRGTPESALVDRRPQLERLPVDAFQLVGVSMGPNRVKAILQDAEGRTFLVSEKMRLGNNGGTITKITPESLLVREKLVNVLGEEENVDIEIRLPGDGLDAAIQDAGPSEGTARIGSPIQPRVQTPQGMQGVRGGSAPPSSSALSNSPSGLPANHAVVPLASAGAQGYEAGSLSPSGPGAAGNFGAPGLQVPATPDRPSQIPALSSPNSQGGGR